jgi:DNA-binding CsgD family transcriptional regulator
LELMISYAESNACRRRIILKHFGDSGPANAEVCCDNCRARQAAAMPAQKVETLTQADRAPLIVLDIVRRLERGVGREKIIQILRGSKAQEILKFGYDKNVYYGRLAVYSQAKIKKMIDQLCQSGYLKVVGGRFPILRITPQGEAAIIAKSVISLTLPHKGANHEIERKIAAYHLSQTLEDTAQLFSRGMSIEEIAVQRGLSPITIFSHAAKLIELGRLRVDAIISANIQQKVEAAIRQVGSVEYLSPIKTLLPDEINYDIIRCVVEGWKQQQGSATGATPETTPPQPPTTAEDAVVTFLSRPHPRQLPGPWNTGWALGFHSQFAGADWNRSETGEMAYRLKYQGDLSVLPLLVEQAIALIADHPELVQVNAVVPVPPSVPRANDPVSSFAKALAQKLGLPYLPVLVKSRQTAPQKEMHTLAQKQSNVAGAFTIQAPVKGKRLLVVDDLYDSGATLLEIQRHLSRAGAVKVNVLTLTRTIHSDA